MAASYTRTEYVPRSKVKEAARWADVTSGLRV